MAALEFIFSSFWVWLGTVLIIVYTLDGIQGIIKQFRNKSK